MHGALVFTIRLKHEKVCLWGIPKNELDFGPESLILWTPPLAQVPPVLYCNRPYFRVLFGSRIL